MEYLWHQYRTAGMVIWIFRLDPLMHRSARCGHGNAKQGYLSKYTEMPHRPTWNGLTASCIFSKVSDDSLKAILL